MKKLKELILKYPTRSKYLLLILDIFLILGATRMFINYNNIKLAIEEAKHNTKVQKLELAFTENFLLPYEKSEYSNFFLKHESNILLSKEFIIRFQRNQNTSIEEEMEKDKFDNSLTITKPQESRKQFFYEQLFLKKK